MIKSIAEGLSFWHPFFLDDKYLDFFHIQRHRNREPHTNFTVDKRCPFPSGNFNHQKND